MSDGVEVKKCGRGHLFDAENTYIRPNGKRMCRACASLRKESRAFGKSFDPAALDNLAVLDRIVARSKEVPCPVNGLWLPCWVPVNLKRDRDGYGQISITVNGRAYDRKVHQVAYATLIGPMPDGLVPDHLCRNRACFNPFHLDPVTIKINTARGVNHERAKTHCPLGHPYDEANTHVDRHGHRRCRTCHRAKVAEQSRRRRQAPQQAAAHLTAEGETSMNSADRERCPAAHQDDPTPCVGEVVVMVLDRTNAGARGCEHHGARLLASLEGGRVYGLPEAPEGAAIRVFKAADSIRPFPWVDGPRTRAEQLSRLENRERGES